MKINHNKLIISVFLIFFITIKADSFDDSKLSYSEWSSKFFESWYSWPTFNFDVYYYNVENARDVIDEIENINNLILEDLDFMFMFNTKKTKVYIYRDNLEYHRKTGSSPWAGGHSSFEEMAIYTYAQKDININVIVHELTHLLFDKYINFPKRLDANWMHEGLAVYEERRYKQQLDPDKPVWDLRDLKKKAKNNQLQPFKKALRSHMAFESDSKRVSLWYLRMGTLIAFMVEKGQKGLYVFCENLKSYRNIDEALSKTYPWDFKNIKDLETQWEKWLFKQKDKI